MVKVLNGGSVGEVEGACDSKPSIMLTMSSGSESTVVWAGTGIGGCGG